MKTIHDFEHIHCDIGAKLEKKYFDYFLGKQVTQLTLNTIEKELYAHIATCPDCGWREEQTKEAKDGR